MPSTKSEPIARGPRGGQFVLKSAAGAAAGATLAVAVSPTVIDGLRPHRSIVKQMVEELSSLFSEARRSGRTAGFTITVDADGAPEINTLAREQAMDADDVAERDRAFAAARARGRVKAAEILGGGEMLSADAMADRLGISRVTVNARRQRHELLGLDGAKRGFRFPAWQVNDDGKPLEVLPQLFALLGPSPWTVYRFLTQHHDALDGATARDALQRGRTADVLDAAESVARGDFA
ncbi:hypothetical protein [Sphingomonas sanxanigenens]|uniref:hypothetical protein n=1 Tax=Sphingomonas sanxanigenens TaxID=397260 RepID=UPI00069A46A3|nr:hypothetical protein [Sphingomonas sanxanigenens]